jgi:ankyrin repeat protein
MLAAASRCEKCMARLPTPRDEIDARNALGDTALIIAVRARSPEIARLLVAAGADPDTRNNLRDTARKIATRLKDKTLLAAVSR